MVEKIVRHLERAIDKEILDVLCRMGLKRLPLMPGQQRRHPMAKAATTIYEAAVEALSGGRPMPTAEVVSPPRSDTPNNAP